jgi:glutamate racemase
MPEYASDDVNARPETVAPTLQLPVGVFDSGIGGLTILRELLRELPGERYLYYGDTGNCPYGVRSLDEISQLARNAAEFLIEHGAKLIVVACNTASAAAIHDLRAAFPERRFIAVVPAVKPAAMHSTTRRIIVAATESAAHGSYLRGLIAQFAAGVTVEPIGCQRLVALAEEGVLDGQEVEREIERCIGPALARGADLVALGCTHFPAMSAAFERVCAQYGPHIRIIDSGEAVARQTRRVLEREGLLASPDDGPLATARALTATDEFWRSGTDGAFDRVGAAILPNYGSIPRAQFAEVPLLAPASRAS